MIRSNRWLLIFSLLLASCRGNEPLFESLAPEETGVTFANTLTETEEANILAYEYFYNGGGVATGDFNNDGWMDAWVLRGAWVAKAKHEMVSVTPEEGYSSFFIRKAH